MARCAVTRVAPQDTLGHGATTRRVPPLIVAPADTNRGGEPDWKPPIAECVPQGNASARPLREPSSQQPAMKHAGKGHEPGRLSPGAGRSVGLIAPGPAVFLASASVRKRSGLLGRQWDMSRFSEGVVALDVPIDRAGEIDLVLRAGRGDREAFTQLIERRVASAYRLASAILGDADAANDVVQDAFVSAWVHLPRLRDVHRFDAWLDRIIRNGCRDALRRRRRLREIDLDAAANLSTLDDPVGVGALDTAFARLPLHQRHLLAMHHLAHVPVVDMARQLDIPVGTVKWRLHQARRALEQALEVEG
jgi:RNA polymerase sigma-70 factor (ECF subfamily)